MKIEKDTVVSMEYALRDDAGNVIDQSQPEQPLAYLHGHGNIIPGLEAALDGKAKGDSLEVRLEPGDAYGEVNPALEQVVPRSSFEGVEELEVGMQFRASTAHGPVSVRVVKVEGEEVTVDGNHPLAGHHLNFAVTVKDVRPGTEEEVSHGHLHRGGEGCCGGSGGGSCGC